MVNILVSFFLDLKNSSDKCCLNLVNLKSFGKNFKKRQIENIHDGEEN